MPMTFQTFGREHVIYGRKPNLTHFQPFGIECWIYVRTVQRKDRTLDSRGEPAIYLGRGIVDKMWCHVCHAFNKGAPSSETFHKQRSFWTYFPYESA